jgi:hypothetical protein
MYKLEAVPDGRVRGRGAGSGGYAVDGEDGDRAARGCAVRLPAKVQTGDGRTACRLERACGRKGQAQA